MISKFRKILFGLTHPHITGYFYDKDWDELLELYTESDDYVFKINENIKKGHAFYTFSIIKKEDREDMLDGEVWIANGRFSAGALYRFPQGLVKVRPSKLTIYKMYQKLWKSMTPEQKLVYKNSFNRLYRGYAINR